MTRATVRRAAAAWWAAALLAVPVPAGDDGLTIADLAPYRAALEGRGTPPGPAVPVTFRDLWDNPARYQGRRVRVEGRVARRFRQGAYGTFPPLVEAWAVTPAGDPFCLTYPAPADGAAGGRPDAAPGASVRFEGTFLRRLRYRGADADRLAPLIVGDRPPAVVIPAPARPTPGAADAGAAGLDWALGLVVTAFVALALARRHLSGPSRRPSRRVAEADPPPEFVDGV